MTISKKDFDKALLEQDRKKMNELVNFIKDIPLFSRLTRTYLGKLSRNLKVLNVTKDHVLFKEEQLADKVFIIKKGDFIVTMTKKMQSKQTENI